MRVAARAGRCVAALIFLLGPTAARGQLIRGKVVERGGHEPVAGAFVVLVDTAGVEQAGGLSGPDGGFALRAPAAGIYRLRADRIGLKSTLSRRIALARGDTISYLLETEAQPVSLAGIQVEGEKRCNVDPTSGRATAALWEETRKALEIADAAERGRTLRFRTESWMRELNPQDLRVLSEQTDVRVRYGTLSPFVGADPDSLAHGGYVRALTGGDYQYYAPTANVLLSASFLENHCFGLATREPPDSGAIGLAFEPLGRGPPDVEGVLWLDRSSAELRLLEYEYTHLPWPVPSSRAGGEVRFGRIENGPWIVRSWRILMPTMGRRSLRAGPAGDLRQELVLAQVHEVGGRVLSVENREDRSLLDARAGGIVGMVYDSTRSDPLIGASVDLAGTSRRALTNDRGLFELGALPPGRYRIEVRHPRLDSLQVEPLQRDVSVESGRVVEARLAVPSANALLATQCDAVREGTVALGGVVRDSTGNARADAHVVIRSENGGPVELTGVAAAATADGTLVLLDSLARYRLCGIPAGAHLLAWAVSGDAASDTLRIALAPGQGRVHDFTLPTRVYPIAPLAVERRAGSEAGRERRAQRSHANLYLDRVMLDSLATRGARTVPDALRRLPQTVLRVRGYIDPKSHQAAGVCLEARHFSTTGLHRPCEPVGVWVDGSRIQEEVAPTFLETLQLSEIDTLEFLSPQDATFRYGTGSGTGALVITTRR